MSRLSDLKTKGGGWEWKVIAALFVVAFVLRLVWVILFTEPINPSLDEVSYVTYADDILKKPWLNSPTSNEHREPFYPILIAFIQSIFGAGQEYYNIKVIQCIISSLCVVIVYLMSKRFFDIRIALIASVWTVFFPSYFFYNTFILRESLTVFLVLLWIYFLLKFAKCERIYILALSSVFYTLLIHTDARFVFHLPFMVLYLYAVLPNLRYTLRTVTLFFLFTIILSLPWGIRNHIVYHQDKFVLICTRTLERWGPRALSTESFEEFAVERNMPRTVEEFEIYKRDSEIDESEKAALASGVRPTFSNSGRRVAFFTEFWRFARFSEGYFPYPDLRFQKPWSTSHNAQGILFEGLLYPFMLIGICLSFKERQGCGMVLSLIIFSHTLLHVLIHSQARYRLPIGALISILAVYGFLYTIGLFWSNKRKATAKAIT